MNTMLNKLAMVAAILALSACATLNTPIDGVVIDTSTGKPIAGAFVIVSWHARGGDGYRSRSSCPHMDIVRSDAEGRYRLPAQPYAESDDTWSTVYAYVPGYEWDESVKHERAFLTNMKPFTGTGDERMQRFTTYGSLKGCGSEDTLVATLRPLYIAIEEERRKLVVTNPAYREHQGYVKMLEGLAESIEASKRNQAKNGTQK